MKAKELNHQTTIEGENRVTGKKMVKPLTKFNLHTKAFCYAVVEEKVKNKIATLINRLQSN